MVLRSYSIILFHHFIQNLFLQHSKDDQNKEMTTSNLEIKVATPDMSGNYSCEVSNLGGTVQSDNVCLAVSKSNLHTHY